MKRKEIMDNCPEGFEGDMKDILDYFEGKFCEVRDTLNIDSIFEISNIEDAYNLAYGVAEDLY